MAFFAPLIPLLVSAGKLFVAANVVGFAVRLLAGLGLYFVVMEPVGDALGNYIRAQFQGLPGVVLDWLGFMRIDVYLQLILSAYAIVMASNFAMRIRT